MYSKGHILSEENIRAEMDMSECAWQTFGKDIMDLVYGVPNLHESTVSQQKMLIFVGIPGSGKSTVSNKLVKMNNHWIRVNQDDLKTRKACERLARESLKKGKSVIIDRCNFDISQRNVWVKIASEFAVTDIRCVYFKIPIEICKQRVVVREDHPTIASGDFGIGIIDGFKNVFVEPSPLEGFLEILTVTNDQDIELVESKFQSLHVKPNVSSPPRTPQSPQSEKKSKTGNYNSFSVLEDYQ